MEPNPLAEYEAEDSLLEAVGADLERAADLLINEDSPFLRRVYIRTLLTTVEGFTALLKAEALRWERGHPNTYTPAELGSV